VTGSVSVIIPTTAEPRRRDSLRRAIDSARAQRHLATQLIVVVNGPRSDASLLTELETLPLQVVRLREADLPSAIHKGRLAIGSDYFSFLDDDDVYLPDALASRLEALEAARADFAVSNGLDASGNTYISDIRAVQSDPLKALIKSNWLASCGGLYRSATISAEFFANLTKYLEWTTVAFRLMMAGKRVCFVDHPGFRISDTEGSASKQRSMESMLNAIAVFEDMFTRVPPNIRSSLAGKGAAVYHSTSHYCLQSGDLGQAWRMHASSIRMGGWRYLTYTRHLLFQTLKAWFRA
jgi:glycosyltransferase involved in cell wall biosynthesis